MKRTLNIEEEAVVTEMAIVDTFTKLIFGDESPYSDREQRIITALREVDVNADGCHSNGCHSNVGHSNGCHSNLGVYLRALGVGEMIALVGAVRTGMGQLNCSNLHSRPSQATIHPSALGQAH